MKRCLQWYICQNDAPVRCRLHVRMMWLFDPGRTRHSIEACPIRLAPRGI